MKLQNFERLQCRRRRERASRCDSYSSPICIALQTRRYKIIFNVAALLIHKLSCLICFPAAEFLSSCNERGRDGCGEADVGRRRLRRRQLEANRCLLLRRGHGLSLAAKQGFAAAAAAAANLTQAAAGAGGEDGRAPREGRDVALDGAGGASAGTGAPGQANRAWQFGCQLRLQNAAADCNKFPETKQ